MEPLIILTEMEETINTHAKKDKKKKNVEYEKAYKQFIQRAHSVVRKIEDIGLPRQGEQIRLVTFNTFNAVVFLEYILQKEKAEHVLLVIYTINQHAARKIRELTERHSPRKITILMSNMRCMTQNDRDKFILSVLDIPGAEIIFAQSHAKITGIKTQDNAYIIEGSGNMGYNSRIETYVIDNNIETFNWHLNWIKQIPKELKGKKELITKNDE